MRVRKRFIFNNYDKKRGDAMLLTGRDTDVMWIAPGAREYTLMGHGTRCTVNIDIETVDVLMIRLGTSPTTYWKDKKVTGSAWSGDLDLLCTQEEVDAIMRASIEQLGGVREVRLSVKVGGTQITGKVVILSVDVSGDMDGMTEVSVSFDGAGEPTTAAGGTRTFDMTFDTTFD